MSATDSFGMLETLDAREMPAFVEAIILADRVPMVYGAPGIGKSEIIRELAHRMGFALLDVRLAQMLPEQIAGVQYVDASHTATVALKPSLIGSIERLGKESGKPVMVLWDELTLASSETLSAALEMLLDRRVGGHPVPAGTVMVCAGNRPQDTADAMLLNPPVRARLISCVYKPSTKDTAAYIAGKFKSAIGAAMAEYIETPTARGLVTRESIGDDAAFYTPRGVDMALTAIEASRARAKGKAASDNKLTNVERAILAGSVGKPLASGFASFLSIRANVKPAAELLDKAATAPVPQTDESGNAAAIAQLQGMMAFVRANPARVNDMLTYLERCSSQHLFEFLSSVSRVKSDASLLTQTIRGKRMFSDAGVAFRE